MVWMFPLCSIMHELRLTVLTLMSRDENLELTVSKAEGKGSGWEIKARGPPYLVSCPLAAQRNKRWA